MTIDMPEHMMPQIAELETGEALTWAYAPQRSKPKNIALERRVNDIIYALSLFWLGYMAHGFLSENKLGIFLIVIALVVLGVGYRVFLMGKRRNENKLASRIYDHIIITDQRLKLGRLNRTPSGEFADFRAVPVSQIESAAMDYHQGSPCLAVHVQAESKPVYLVGGYDRDAAMAALTRAA